jgi:hypothetical protein
MDSLISTDGAKTFQIMRGTDKDSEQMHGDNHALWIDPTNSDYIINGNDGGVILSYNGGAKWKKGGKYERRQKRHDLDLFFVNLCI